MANYTCPHCRQTFHIVDDLEGPCLFCGRRMNEFRPPKFLIPHGADLQVLASRHRWFLYLLTPTLAAQGLAIFAPSFEVYGVRSIFFAVVFVAALAVVVALLLAEVKASGGIIVLSVLVTPVPVVNFLIIIHAHTSALAVFKAVGLRVGLFGVRDADARHRMNPDLCVGCGYNLTGNLSGRCPECGLTIPRHG